MADRDEIATLVELRRAWGIEPDGPFLVVGLLQATENSEAIKFHFLEDLEHPLTGAGLVYPGSTPRTATKAYVSGRDARAFLKASRGVQLWALAELELSPVEERDKHNNRWECNVKSGSLRPLVNLPESWQLTLRGTQKKGLIGLSAYEAIVAETRLSMSQEVRAHEADLAKATAGLAEMQRLLLDVTRQTQGAEEALASNRDAAEMARKEIQRLRDALAKETKLMEARMESLQELIRIKGGRLKALGLIDADDLAAILPRAAPPPSGQSLGEAFDGDGSRLAAHVQAELWARNLIFPQERIRNFLALARTSDVVILAGDSGAGKSALVKAVAQSIGAVCTVIAVKPNWTGPEDLLGYFNPVERKFQSTPFLQALLAAEADPNRLHFILLDEMNLARVEYYFADFLSLLETRDRGPEIPLFTQEEASHVAMESHLFLSIEEEARLLASLGEEATFEDILKDEIANASLHELGGFKNAQSVLVHHDRLRRALSSQFRIPASLRFPSNVRIMGAINMDETTHGLSPKVLDRVHVLRFSNPLLMDWDAIAAEIVPSGLTGPLQILPEEFGARADYPPFDPTDPQAQFLKGLASLLDALGVEFGFRALRQSLGYLKAAQVAGLDAEVALNNVILQKVLPKLTLDTERTGADGRPRHEVLRDLRKVLAARFESTEAETSCVDKLDRLIDAAAANNGLASYWLR